MNKKTLLLGAVLTCVMGINSSCFAGGAAKETAFVDFMTERLQFEADLAMANANGNREALMQITDAIIQNRQKLIQAVATENVAASLVKKAKDFELTVFDLLLYRDRAVYSLGPFVQEGGLPAMVNVCKDYHAKATVLAATVAADIDTFFQALIVLRATFDRGLLQCLAGDVTATKECGKESATLLDDAIKATERVAARLSIGADTLSIINQDMTAWKVKSKCPTLPASIPKNAVYKKSPIRLQQEAEEQGRAKTGQPVKKGGLG